jgi:hypothetical protein
MISACCSSTMRRSLPSFDAAQLADPVHFVDLAMVHVEYLPDLLDCVGLQVGVTSWLVGLALAAPLNCRCRGLYRRHLRKDRKSAEPQQHAEHREDC